MPLTVIVRHRFQRREHAEHAVIAPGVTHRVQMRTEQQRGAPGVPLITAADIADAVLQTCMPLSRIHSPTR